jgi:CheY-like chemotaxis protein
MDSKIATIFLAEDNQADVFLVRTALEEEGLEFKLRAFSDGEEMLRLLDELDSTPEQTNTPELFLLDLNLPRYSGEEILDRLEKSPRCCKSPVIVLTSSDSPKDRQRAASRGVAEYFRKPTDLEEFMSLGKVVRNVLDHWTGSSMT